MAVSFTIIIVAAIGVFLVGLLLTMVFDGKRKKTGEHQSTSLVPQPSAKDELRTLVEKGGNARVLMEGGFRLRETFHSQDGFIVRGTMQLEADSVLHGPVEVFGNAALGERARCASALFVHGDLTLGRDSKVPTCRVDGNVYFHPGAQVEGALECHAVYLLEGPMDTSTRSEAVNFDTPITTVG